IAPEGCLVNTKYPAPVAARHLTGHLLPFAVFGALSQVIPERVVSDGSLSVTLQFDGKRPAGDGFLSTFFNAGGMGARPDRDGLSATSFPNNLSNTPVEVIESEAPFRFLQKELLTDSGGAGARRGGLAQVMRLQTLGTEPLTISAMFERTRFAAQGFQGGGPGSLLEVELEGGRPLPGKRRTSLPPGSILRVRLAGGGGFGPPTERDPESVLNDIRKGLVSAEAARRDYRVAIDPDALRIDREATEGLRKNPESSDG
ncbi:MAG: hydantoinase B/oxoprolinase family protein, partial [Nitrospinota bacterium]|nr:hydantoinase B/oxoprolinase family protein [Nitrospinota bacterium]